MILRNFFLTETIKMPTEAVEKPLDDTKPEEASASGTDSDSDDSMPDLEEGDASQPSQVNTNDTKI